MRILITGASGCVGRYLVEALLEVPEHRLVLAVRDAAKLPETIAEDPRVEVLEADLRDTAEAGEILDGTDAGLLVATAWGGDETHDVTVNANLAIADRLIAGGCGHVLYFATASVLAQDGTMLPAAAELGTEYIRAKFALVEAMEARADRARITGLFPTLVFGGRREAPEIRLSHFANLATEVWPWLWLIRFLSAEGRFNVIHARDIASVVAHLVAEGGRGEPRGAARHVLGNPAEDVDDIVAQVLAQKGRKRRTFLRIRPSMIDWLVRLTPIQLSGWDRYCADHPDQSHPNAVNPASFGLPVHMPRIGSGLASIGLGPRR